MSHGTQEQEMGQPLLSCCHDTFSPDAQLHCVVGGGQDGVELCSGAAKKNQSINQLLINQDVNQLIKQTNNN